MRDGTSAFRARFDHAGSQCSHIAIQGKRRDGIVCKTARGCSLRASEKRRDKLISTRRFRIVRVVGTVKRLFDLDTARYLDSAKTQVQIAMTAIAVTRLKVAHKLR